MSQFATAAELSTYLTGDAAPSDALWIAQANLLLEMVSADIQSACAQTIETGTGTHKIAGTWDRDLILPQRPVTSITSVAVNGSPLAASAYTWNERSLLRRGSLSYSDDFDPEFDWRTLGMQGAGWLSGSHWGGPDSTIEVEYAWGSATVPSVVKSLALRVAGRVIGNPTGVSSEQLGAYSVQYGKAVDAGATHLNRHEIRMLRKRFGRTGGTINPQGAIG